MRIGGMSFSSMLYTVDSLISIQVILGSNLILIRDFFPPWGHTLRSGECHRTMEIVNLCSFIFHPFVT